MKTSARWNGKVAQAGAMLLEALIALLIFAVGVIGLMAMQATATRLAADGKYRAEAQALADQIIHQMWADDRSNAHLTAQYATGGAKYNAWAAQVQAAGTGLPGANLAGNQPTIVIGADNVVTVTIFWQGPGEAAAHRHVTVAQIN